MCGIAGIIEYKKSSSSVKSNIYDILNIQKHRGPDNVGVKIFEYNNLKISLGHNRLAIIDLKNEANQPFFDNSFKYSIVFNGEIYNYLELKQNLINKYNFKTNSDTEVLLASYIIYGNKCLNYIEGMFSFVIYNIENGTFWGARDPVGIKPFYYSNTSCEFIFASEPDSIWKNLHSKPTINSKTVSDFLLFGLTDHTEETFFNNIFQLKGGHCISGKVGTNDLKIEKYWYETITKYDNNFNYSELVSNEVYRSVKLHLQSDVPIGGCLSGGLDSGTINYFASKILSKDNQIFNSLTFTEKNFIDDELLLATMSSNSAGSKMNLVETTEYDLLNNLDTLTEVMGEPFNSLSMFAQFKVFETASNLGIKVMLDGQGGDEIFVGYHRVASLILKENIKKLKFKSAWFELTGFKENSNLNYLNLIGMNYYFSNQQFVRKRNSSKLNGLVSNEILENYNKEVVQEYYGNKNLFEAQKMELNKYIIPRLLRYEDRNSMHFSIEARVPFLTKSMINLGLSLPSKAKVNNGWTKYSLRAAMENKLPKEIIWQKKKVGFDVPQDKWINSIKSNLIEKINDNISINKYINASELVNQISKGNGSKDHIWRLISLQLWLIKNDLKF